MMAKNCRAFTLIELLIVIAIIGILAGLVLSTSGYIQKKGARSRTEAEIAAITVALENYKVDNGEYPPWTNTVTSPAGNNKPLVDALRTNKVYLELKKSQTNSSGYLIDPFGNSFGYQYPGDVNRSGSNFFDLWSSAAATDSNVWIKNW